MKKKLRLSMIVLLGIFLFLAGSIVQAQVDNSSAVIDEYGTGFVRDVTTNGPWYTWTGTLRSDPTWSGHQSLVYIAGTRFDS